MNTIDRHLQNIAVSDRIKRRVALEKALSDEQLNPTVQAEEKTEKILYPVQNYLLLPENTKDSFPLFCAHYDTFGNSTGANDNAAAVCILIELAKTFKEKQICAGFAFFDGGNDEHRGAKLFESLRDKSEFSAVINLDLCGYGDTIAIHNKSGTKKEGIRNFCDAKRLKTHNGKLVKFLPQSDDSCFNTRRQPVLNIAVVPKWDIKYLDALATYQNSFFGKPPEYNMIMGQLEVITTIHGEFRDELKWVEPQAMYQVYNFLLDAVMSPIQNNKKISLFGSDS